MKKLAPKQVRVVSFLVLAVGALIAFSGIGLGEKTPVILTGLLVMFASVILHLLFYRCPHCGRYLDRNTGEFCPYCGKKVNEKDQ